MPRLSAPHWNEKDGVCTKHMLPQVPCQQCASEKDKNVEVRWSENDFDVLRQERWAASDLLPLNFAYLMQ